jgi:hypothetical protein
MNLAAQVLVSALTSTVVATIISTVLKYRFDVKLARMAQELRIAYDLTQDRIRQRHEVLPKVADQVYRVRNKVRDVLGTLEAGAEPGAKSLDELRQQIMALRDILFTYRLLLEIEELFRLFHGYLGKVELFVAYIANMDRRRGDEAPNGPQTLSQLRALYQEIDADHERIVSQLKLMMDSTPTVAQ